jgi:hypothetical protein
VHGVMVGESGFVARRNRYPTCDVYVENDLVSSPCPLRMTSHASYVIVLDFAAVIGSVLNGDRVEAQNSGRRIRDGRVSGWESDHACSRSLILDDACVCSPHETQDSCVQVSEASASEAEAEREFDVSCLGARRTIPPPAMDCAIPLALISCDDCGLVKDFDSSDVFLMASGGCCVWACPSLACPATPALYYALVLLLANLSAAGTVMVSVCDLGCVRGAYRAR